MPHDLSPLNEFMESLAARTDMKTTEKAATKSAFFIISVEVAERFAYYGVAGNLITYLTNVLGEPVAVAAKHVNTWMGVSALFPLLGAFVADSYLGQFLTILISTLIYLSGMILLTSSVSVIPLPLRHAVFYVALYILSVGEGGHKPCVQTFAADQFEEDTPEEKKVKSSFFNWWYLGIVFGSTSAILVVIYVEDYVSWSVGFGIPTAMVAVALVVFLLGAGTYRRRRRPVGSPYTRVAQVLVAAVRKRRVIVTSQEASADPEDEGTGSDPERVWALARKHHQFGLLDKAAVVDDADRQQKTRNPWRLCSQKQVEEVKLVLRLVPIWLCCFMFTIVNAQMSTFFTKQCATLRRSLGPGHFQVPPASFQVFAGLSILLVVPVYDRFLVPLARSATGHPAGITILQRMGAGLLVSTLNMALCSLVESKRVAVARDHGLLDAPRVVLPMAAWWLVPQYLLVGLSDALTVVGMQELFYDQVPEEMRSMGAAAYISTIGLGNFLSSAVISIVQAATGRDGREKWLTNNLNRGRLDRFFGLLAGLSALNLSVFLWAANKYVYKKAEETGPSSEDPREEERGSNVPS